VVPDANTDTVREAIEAFSRGQLEESLSAFHPDVVWEVDQEFFLEGGTYRGHEGVLEFWGQWRDAFEGFELVIEECEAVGEEHVLVMSRAQGRGAGSGAPVGSPAFAHVYELRDGRIVRMLMHPSREEALRAAGPPE
jgi:ketosteroid isomerase-like protein